MAELTDMPGKPTSGVWIAGQVVEPSQPLELASHDASTGELHGLVVGGGAEDARAATAAATTAFETWRDTPGAERGQVLRRIAEAFRVSATSDLPEIISRETGKRLGEAVGELHFSAAYFDLYARLAEDDVQSWWPGNGQAHFVRHRPAGVAAVVTPWNFPASIPARKIAPAIAAGCSVLWKPSEVVPMSSLGVADLIGRSLSDGILSTVSGHGEPILGAWLEDPRVRVVSFTGSTNVGRIVARGAAETFTRSVLELGGQAPFVILEDADLDAAIDTLDVAKFRNNGQSCIAANRVWVPRHLLSDVTAALADRVTTKVVGNSREEATQLGPMALASDPARLQGLVDDAAAHGAEIIQGEAPLTGGHFMPPTLCIEPREGAALLTQEIFGPVVAVTAYDDLEDVVLSAATLPHGLAGYVCSRDRARAIELLDRFDIGIAGVNTGSPNHVAAPFGGAGQSGWGYEGGQAGLLEFLQPQLIASRGGGE